MIPSRIAAEAKEWPGVSILGIDQGGKHRRMTIRYADRERFIVLPTTVSDWRSELNQVRDFRKVVSELGATRNVRAKARVKRERNRPDRTLHLNIERAPVKANPFEVLAQVEFAPEPMTPSPTLFQRLLTAVRKFLP